jgi:hypothetical protein
LRGRVPVLVRVQVGSGVVLEVQARVPFWMTEGVLMMKESWAV